MTPLTDEQIIAVKVDAEYTSQHKHLEKLRAVGQATLQILAEREALIATLRLLDRDQLSNKEAFLIESTLDRVGAR